MGHTHSIRENPTPIAGIAILAAAVGAITAMLITPKRGDELRHTISTKVGQGKDTVTDKIQSKKDDIADKANDVKEQAKDKAADIADKTEETADKAKDKADR